MEKQQEVVKEVLDEASYMNFERQAMQSIDRMVYNSLTTFMLLSMFRQSTTKQKEEMIVLFEAMRKDIKLVHKEKAELSFELSDEQKEKYNYAVETTIQNVFRLIDNEIHTFRAVQEKEG